VKLWSISLLFVATGALADIGSVTELSGVAIIKRGSNTITVVKGSLVETNDKVETKNGKVKITFKDNTTVNVTESSSLVIDDFVYDPKSGAGKLNLKAASGTVRYASGNIAHNNPNAVNIKTPTAAIAVRGTDFVMSVDETGKSAVILMPTCEIEHNVNLKGLTCGSGAIDVDSGSGIVKMNRPYQATIVETSTMPPLPPIIVDLGNTPIGNNLMLSPLRTPGGISIQIAARSAAEKTGDARKRDDKDKKDDTDKKDDNTPSLVENAAVNSGNRRPGDSLNSDESQGKIKITADSLKDAGVDVRDKSTGDEHFYSIYKDASKTQVIGQGYEVLSPSGHNYANVVQSLDSKAVIVITQDRVVNAFDFSGTGKSTGSIVISQTWK
jgi:FecR protein